LTCTAEKSLRPGGSLSAGPYAIEAFENKELIRMHNSTVSKIGFFSSIMKKLISGKLHTASRGFGVMIDKLFEGPPLKTTGFLSMLVGISVGLWQTYLWQFA
jgi:hypothetical protein